MKDSGIEWIGEIPEGWEVAPIRSCFDEVRTKNTNGQEQNALQFKFGNIISKTNFNANADDYVADAITNYTVVLPDTVMINGLNLNYDFKSLRVALVKEKGVITSAYLAIFPDRKKISPQYATYLFKGYETKMAFHNMGAGIRKTLGYKEFKNQPLLLPSKKEQNKISAYLDSKCSHIDIMLSKIRSSIEEYKKLKQAVITQAVTKGVRGEREMKDSGVEWIGEIPKKWNRCKLNSICAFINGDRSKNYPSSEDFQDIGIPFIGADSLNGFFVDTYSARHISPAKYASMGGLKITQGDILYTLRGSTIGKNAIANFNDGTIASSLVGIRVKSPFLASSSFLFYWLNSLNEFVQRDLCINGSTAPNLSAENVAQFFIYIPDITEQHEIADYLDAKCAEIDKLIAKKEQLVKELDSYKKSLIYEVVTGKRKV